MRSCGRSLRGATRLFLRPLALPLIATLALANLFAEAVHPYLVLQPQLARQLFLHDLRERERVLLGGLFKFVRRSRAVDHRSVCDVDHDGRR